MPALSNDEAAPPRLPHQGARGDGAADGPTPDDVLQWLDQYRERLRYAHEQIPFSESASWFFEEANFRLTHRTGWFFSVSAFANDAEERLLIDQPEIGTQGFILHRLGGKLFVLAQARTEPGNPKIVEIGPTIQATYSNYSKKHRGRSTLFLDLFHSRQDPAHRKVVDVTLPELGSFFFRKYNRNLIIEVSNPEGFSSERFRWIELSVVTQLLIERNHVVNNDARLLIGLIIAAYFGPESCIRNDSRLEKPFEALRQLQLRWKGNVRRFSLSDLRDWEVRPDEISRKDGGGYSVIQLRVEASDREVFQWDQPMIQTVKMGFVGLLVRRHLDRGWEILARFQEEIGNTCGFLLGPTLVLDDISLLEGGTAFSGFFGSRQGTRMVDVICSDEGGRFFRCLYRYVVCDITNCSDQLHESPASNFHWIDVRECLTTYGHEESLSDDCRGILAMFLGQLVNSGEMAMRSEPITIIR